MQTSYLFTVLNLALTAAALPTAERREPMAWPLDLCRVANIALVPVCCNRATNTCVAYDPTRYCDGYQACCNRSNIVPVSLLGRDYPRSSR